MKAPPSAPNNPNSCWAACRQVQQAPQPLTSQRQTLFPAFNLSLSKSPNSNSIKWNSADGSNSPSSAQASQSSADQNGLPKLFSGAVGILYLILQFCQTTFPLMSSPFSSQLDPQALFAAATRPFQLPAHSCSLQMDSISQFLELRPSPFNQQGLWLEKQPQTDSKSDQQQAESLPTLGQPRPAAHTPKKPSLFHNFQKHLITTIRACVRLKPALQHRRSAAGLAHELWEYFVGQRRSSKRFLLGFLGRGKDDNKSSPKESSSSKEFQHLLRDFSEYSSGEVREAQEYLCREITRQGRKIILQEQAGIGRINRPKEFRLYFAKFIEELEHGEVRKRLPKLVKIELANTNADENE